VEYLTAQQILYIHARVIAETGGAHGVRDLRALQAAVARPPATFACEDLYGDTFAKVVALFESLILNRPFVDGIKRTAVTAAALFLLRNGFRLECPSDELEAFALAAAGGELSPREMADWFRRYAVPHGGDSAHSTRGFY
jgi:death-on-curing protein